MLSAETLPRSASGVLPMMIAPPMENCPAVAPPSNSMAAAGWSHPPLWDRAVIATRPATNAIISSRPLRATSPTVARLMVPMAAPAPSADMSIPNPAGPMSNTSAA